MGSFESACRMIEAGVGVLPESAARRHARSLDELPTFARDLMDVLSEDASLAAA